jgi:hypothetical protein
MDHHPELRPAFYPFEEADIIKLQFVVIGKLPPATNETTPSIKDPVCSFPWCAFAGPMKPDNLALGREIISGIIQTESLIA